MTDHDDSEVPAPTADRTVYLHIGTLKSGTSYLQSVLLRNRGALEADGLLFPTGDRRWGAQVRAVRDVLGIKGRVTADGAWSELVDEVDRFSGRAIISMEFLSLASDATVETIMSSFGSRPVSVILGARDLARVLPSAWQSMVKQGHPWSFEDFATAVSEPGRGDQDAYRRFWHHHDLTKIIETWAPHVRNGKVFLLTVPPSGAPSTLLWERFAGIVGVEPDRYDASQDQNSNFSLSLSDAELMRRISAVLRPQIGRAAFKRWATRFFANHILRASTPDVAATDRVRLTADNYAWVIDKSKHLVTDLSNQPVEVVGDLNELVPSAPPADTLIDGPNVPATVFPEAAIDMIAKLVKRLADVDPELADDGADDRARRGARATRRGGKRGRVTRSREYDRGAATDDDDLESIR